MNTLKTLLNWLAQFSLVSKIAAGIVLGIALAMLLPESAKAISFLGQLFVGALKAVAPVLVLFLVLASIANQKADHSSNMRPIVLLYIIGTLAAAFTAVLLSFLFPIELVLVTNSASATPPEGISEVLSTFTIQDCAKSGRCIAGS